MFPVRWIVSSEMGNITLGFTSGATALTEPIGMGLIDSIFPASTGNLGLLELILGVLKMTLGVQKLCPLLAKRWAAQAWGVPKQP